MDFRMAAKQANTDACMDNADAIQQRRLTHSSDNLTLGRCCGAAPARWHEMITVLWNDDCVDWQYS